MTNFDLDKHAFVIVDAHITGIGAILAQGVNLETAKPTAIASRTTSATEKRYPQLDLEALAVDFGLRRFRHSLVHQTLQQLLRTTNYYVQSLMEIDQAHSAQRKSNFHIRTFDTQSNFNLDRATNHIFSRETQQTSLSYHYQNKSRQKTSTIFSTCFIQHQYSIILVCPQSQQQHQQTLLP